MSDSNHKQGTDSKNGVEKGCDTKKRTTKWNPLNEGLVDGALRVPVDSRYFPQFLTAYYRALRQSVRINKTEENIRELENELKEAKKSLSSLEGALSMSEANVEELESSIKTLNEERRKRNFSRTAKHDEVVNIHPEYGLFPSFLFLIVGIVFVATDLIVTHNIFQDLLNIPSVEAWFLGTGLALTSFGIKFVFDRFLEKPYRELNKKVWLLFIGVLLVLASVVMMGLAGHFRIYALGVKEREYSLLNDQFAEQENLLNSLEEEERGNFEDPVEETWLKIYDQKSILVVFVLSSILFLLVGSFCFSIAFHDLHLHAKKWVYWWPGRLFRWTQDKNWLKKYSSLKEKLIASIGARKALFVELEQLFAQIEKNEKMLQHEYKLLDSLVLSFFESMTTMDKMLYFSAYERGVRWGSIKPKPDPRLRVHRQIRKKIRQTVLGK